MISKRERGSKKKGKKRSARKMKRGDERPVIGYYLNIQMQTPRPTDKKPKPKRSE